MERFSFIGLNPGVKDDNAELFMSNLGNNLQEQQQMFLDSLLIVWLLALKITFLIAVLIGIPPPRASDFEKFTLFILSLDVWNITNLIHVQLYGEFEHPMEISIMYNVCGYATFATLYYYLYWRSQRMEDDGAAEPPVNGNDDDASDEEEEEGSDVSTGGPGETVFETPAKFETSPDGSPSPSGQHDGEAGDETDSTVSRGQKGGQAGFVTAVELQINGKALPVPIDDSTENGLSISLQDEAATNGSGPAKRITKENGSSHPERSKQVNGSGKVNGSGSVNGNPTANGSGSVNGSATANGSGSSDTGGYANGSARSNGNEQGNNTASVVGKSHGSGNVNGSGSANGSSSTNGNEHANGAASVGNPHANGNSVHHETTANGSGGVEKQKLVGPEAEAITTEAADDTIPPLVSQKAPISTTAESAASSASPSSEENVSPQQEYRVDEGHVVKLADATGTDAYRKQTWENKGKTGS